MIRDRSIWIKNVFHMLAYAFQDLHPDHLDDLKGEKFDRIHDLLAAVLAQGIARQLKQGLHRDYLDKTEDLPMLHGKLHLPNTIRNRISRRNFVACEYDDLSENNLLNQILKTTALLLIRHGDVSSARRSELKKRVLFFSTVDEIEPAGISWSVIRFTRSTQSYRMLIAVCQLVADGMLLTDERGQMRLMKYVKPEYMNRLFEKFILEYYRKEHPELSASASRIPWALDEESTAGQLPAMQSDILLQQGNRILIIDAKYYGRAMQQHFDHKTVHSANLYQIFAYVKNQAAFCAARGEARTVSGMLLYAKTDEATSPKGEFPLSGNRISVRTLDLNREFTVIKYQLDGIVNENFAS